MERALLWKLFCMTGEPLAYIMYRCAEGPEDPVIE